jgi:hypothetical protein
VEVVTRRIAVECAGFNLGCRAGAVPAPTQVVELDGSMVPIVEFIGVEEVDDPAAKADKRKRRTCGWKEIRVCTAHDTGRAAARYGACFGGVLEAGCMMRSTSVQCGFDERTHIHGVGDGATWIADQFEKQFGLQSTYLIDFYHLCEYLGAAARTCAPPGGQQAWLERQKARLYNNGYQEVIDDLKASLEPAHISGEDAPVRGCWRYLTNRKAHLDYKGARAKDLPIGSGEVESAHRHVIGQRLKLPGAWWKKENASNMAQLRVTRANDQWNHFWNEKAA